MERIKEVLDSSILTDFKYCREFERKFAEYVGSKYAVATNSGTAALEIMIRALKLKGEIVVPTNTFAATVYAILRAGCKPIFADSGEDMYVSPVDLASKATDRTEAVMLMHVGGFISDSLPVIMDLCEDKGITLLEDACHAHGSVYDGKKAGTLGKVAAFSFFPTKVIGSAEGGMLVTDDEELKSKAEIYRDQGKVKGNICTLQGYNWRMNEVQAIIGLTQLRRIEEFISERTRIATYYDEHIKELEPKVTPLMISKKSRPNYYKYIAFLDAGIDRERLESKLRSQNIALGGYVYEIPCHLNTVFKNLGYVVGDYPVAERLSKSHVCFPLMVNLTLEQAEYFIECLKKELE